MQTAASQHDSATFYLKGRPRTVSQASGSSKSRQQEYAVHHATGDVFHVIIPIQLCSISSPKNPLKKPGLSLLLMWNLEIGTLHLTGCCPFNAKKVAVGRLGGRPFPFLVLMEGYITSESLIEPTAETIKGRISPKKKRPSVEDSACFLAILQGLILSNRDVFEFVLTWVML